MYSSLPDWLFSLSSLQELYMSSIRYHGPIPDAIGNLTSLVALDLSNITQIEAGLPETLSNLCVLQELDLYNSPMNKKLDRLRTSFSGCVKNSLQYLDLSYTSLSGKLPRWLGELKNLWYLDISDNSLDGPIYNFLNSLSRKNLGNSSKLIELSLAGNFLVGNLTEKFFLNLENLKKLDLKYNSLFLNISPDWIPPFQLEILGLIGCKVGPSFPAWLKTQNELTFLEMSSMGITDSIPDWFWNVTSNIWTLDLCCNGITGYLPDSLNFSRTNGLVIKLSYNNFEGSLPLFPSNTHSLDVSSNRFQGPIPANICQQMPSIQKLILSDNNFSGSLPPLCNCQDIVIFEIQNTSISGQLPVCRTPPQNLLSLWIVNNVYLSGSIPDWVCLSPMLRSLHLINNNLSGEFPSSLSKCYQLLFLDLAGNKFKGNLPIWLAKRMPKLKSLSLSSNMFSGPIPSELSQLTNLQLLDLSNNNFYGAIPRSFGQFAFMNNTQTSIDDNPYIWALNETGMTYLTLEVQALNIKGREYWFSSNMLQLVILIDLSYNNLSGSIPEEVMNLIALQSLNLTGNLLTGRIPDSIDKLQNLQSLDLSRNNLSGTVPSILSSLSFLGVLNLSYNNFSGPIPSGGHLDTFDESTYIGNPYLCGLPLSVKCPQDDPAGKQVSIATHDNEMDSFYLLFGIGFAVGIWMVFGCLMFNKTLRVTLFLYVDNILDSIYVNTILILRSLEKIKEKCVNRIEP